MEAELEDGGIRKVKENWKQLKTHHQENGKLWYMYKMNYHAARKNQQLILGITQISLTDSMLGIRSQTQIRKDLRSHLYAF